MANIAKIGRGPPLQRRTCLRNRAQTAGISHPWNAWGGNLKRDLKLAQRRRARLGAAANLGEEQSQLLENAAVVLRLGQRVEIG